jgi:hypothetical protein
MAYQRFLTNNDYRAVLTPEQFEMLVNGDENRLSQAEQSAEMNFLEYLDQHYEIEKLFRVGKSIKDYNVGVTYPANAFFKKDGVVYKTMKPINGRKVPSTTIYWEQLTDLMTITDADHKPKYSQLATYSLGDVVRFGTEWYACKVPNGYDMNDIYIPGTIAWQQVATTEWQPNMEWTFNQVCSYEGQFYLKTSLETSDSDEVITPVEDETWSLIGDYSSKYNYTLDANDYVVSDGCVFEPIMNPNADDIEVGVNIIRDDPRNINVITHMTRIACYYLHQMVSPTNISESRRLAYEDSILWLSNAARFKINPKIPRKQEDEHGTEVVDFALETYQREFDPYQDMWLI